MRVVVAARLLLGTGAAVLHDIAGRAVSIAIVAVFMIVNMDVMTRMRRVL